MRYGIDAPTLVRIAADGVFVRPTHQLVAPNRIRSDALQLLLDRVRAGELDESVALAYHELMTGTKLRLLGDRVSRRVAWDLAVAKKRTALAATEYVAVASLQADALVASDPHVVAAAKGVVSLAELADLAR